MPKEKCERTLPIVGRTLESRASLGRDLEKPLSAQMLQRTDMDKGSWGSWAITQKSQEKRRRELAIIQTTCWTVFFRLNSSVYQIMF